MEINFASKDIEELLKRNPELLPDSVTERLMQPNQVVSFDITATCRDKATPPEDTNSTHYLRWGTFLSFIGYMASLTFAFIAVWVSPQSMPFSTLLSENLGFFTWLLTSTGIFVGLTWAGYFLTSGMVALIGLVLGKKPVLRWGNRNIPFMLLVDHEKANFKKA